MLAAAACLFPLQAEAQSESLLKLIEEHNTTLATQRRQIEATYAESRSENRLSDPEAEVGYFSVRPRAFLTA